MKTFVVIQGESREKFEADAMFSTDKGEVHFIRYLAFPEKQPLEKIAVVVLAPGMIIRQLPE